MNRRKFKILLYSEGEQTISHECSERKHIVTESCQTYQGGVRAIMMSGPASLESFLTLTVPVNEA